MSDNETKCWIVKNKVSRIDMFLLGIITILGGQYSGWSAGYVDGMGVSAFALCLLTVAYLMMCTSLAEMTSALPFSGGIYGLARAFVHPSLGLLVAMLELTMNIFFIAPSVYHLASIPVFGGQMKRESILPGCVLIYFFVWVVCYFGGRVQWSVNFLLGAAMLALAFIYQFGSLPYANFQTWGGNHATNSIDFSLVLKDIPRIATIYLGTQFLPLISRVAKNPKKDIPIMMMAAFSLSVLLATGFMVLACSQSPGMESLVDEVFPLLYGFGRIFQIAENLAIFLNIPFSLGSIFGFVLLCGRQMSMMSKSGLLPFLFQTESTIFQTPYVAFTTVPLLAFLLNIVVYCQNDESLNHQFFLSSTLASFLIYIAALVAFLLFHGKYSSLERTFTSPFGRIGAVLGILLFMLALVGACIFQDGGYLHIVIVLSVLVLSTIYQVFFAGKQVFSEEEKEELFKAYLMNGTFLEKLFGQVFSC